MKFQKLTLEESLFDDDVSFWDDPEIDVEDYDDSSFEIIPDEHLEDVPEGPALGLPSGMADTLINLINDEWEAIQGYNNFREMILAAQRDAAADYSYMLRVIDEVSNEENKHVGQLQELLKIVSPNANSIADGEAEGRAQIAQATGNEWVNGKLKVEFHQPSVTEAQNSTSPNEIDSACYLSNVDDEM